MKLYNGKEIGNNSGDDWIKVAQHMDNTRSPNDCSSRWNEQFKHANQLKANTSWTQDEVCFIVVLNKK